MSSTEGNRWNTEVLLEKSVTKEQKERRKRTWIKNQVWKPIKESVGRYSARISTAPPL